MRCSPNHSFPKHHVYVGPDLFGYRFGGRRARTYSPLPESVFLCENNFAPTAELEALVRMNSHLLCRDRRKVGPDLSVQVPAVLFTQQVIAKTSCLRRSTPFVRMNSHLPFAQGSTSPQASLHCTAAPWPFLVSHGDSFQVATQPAGVPSGKRIASHWVFQSFRQASRLVARS